MEELTEKLEEILDDERDLEYPDFNDRASVERYNETITTIKNKLRNTFSSIPDDFLVLSDYCENQLSNIEQSVSNYLSQKGLYGDIKRKPFSDFIKKTICVLRYIYINDKIQDNDFLSVDEKEIAILNSLIACQYKGEIPLTLVYEGLRLTKSVENEILDMAGRLNSKEYVSANGRSVTLKLAGLQYIQQITKKRLKEEYYIEEGLTENQKLHFEESLIRFKEEVKEHIDEKFKEQANLITLCNSILDELFQESITQAINGSSKKSIFRAIRGFIVEKALDEIGDEAVKEPTKHMINYMYDKLQKIFGEDMFQKLGQVGFDKLLN